MNVSYHLTNTNHNSSSFENNKQDITEHGCSDYKKAKTSSHSVSKHNNTPSTLLYSLTTDDKNSEDKNNDHKKNIKKSSTRKNSKLSADNKNIVFICDICKYTSNRKSNLKIHKLTHVNHDIQPYRFNCDKCDYKGDIKCNFVTHQRRYHEPKKKSKTACDI